MLRLDEDISGSFPGTEDVQFGTREVLSRLDADIESLKQRIANQVSHIRELTWEAQDSASAKKTLHEMRGAIRDWYAERDLPNKLLRGES
jgi:deoxyadenosine/deoxycytidine kinase